MNRRVINCCTIEGLVAVTRFSNYLSPKLKVPLRPKAVA